MNAQTPPGSHHGLIPAAPEGRFDGIRRPYSREDALKLRGSVQIQHTLAKRGAQRLWQLFHARPYALRSAP